MDKSLWMMILSYVVPVALAWLLKSPLKKWIPDRAARVIAQLKPETIDKVVSFCSSKDARREAAIMYLQRLAVDQKIAITDELAGEVVDAIAVMYKNVIGRLKK